eukprot:3602899-Prymnesium_polylepis.4
MRSCPTFARRRRRALLGCAQGRRGWAPGSAADRWVRAQTSGSTCPGCTTSPPPGGAHDESHSLAMCDRRARRAPCGNLSPWMG